MRVNYNGFLFIQNFLHLYFVAVLGIQCIWFSLRQKWQRLKINFKNYGFLDISQQFNSESYEDRLYAFTEDILYINKVGKIPQGYAFQIDFGSDPNYKYYFVSWWDSYIHE